MQWLSRGVRIPMLILLIVPAIFLFLLYKSNLHQYKSEDEVNMLIPALQVHIYCKLLHK
jgi:hypothetical protein